MGTFEKMDKKEEKELIHKIKPELTLYLAEEALRQKFLDDKANLQEFLKVQKDCRDYLSAENIRKIYARMMKIEVTRMMVDAIYQSLTIEEQKFIKMKYQEKKQLVAISLVLNISVAQLNNWHRMILEKVAMFMQYELSEEDIFIREKVACMVEVLAKIVEFVGKYDADRNFINEYWAKAIIEKLDKYFELLKKLDEVKANEKNSLHYKIIFLKMIKPNEKVEVMAEKCNVNKSIISRHLKNFVEKVRKYLD